MNPIITVQDDFFFGMLNPVMLREAIFDKGFDDVVSPVDNVKYPFICDLNDSQETFKTYLELTLGVEVKINFLFARAMPMGVQAPNKVHADMNMGAYAAHVYLSSVWPDGAGTAFYTHPEVGYKDQSTNNAKIGVLSNKMDEWSEYLRTQAKFNRLLVHRCEYYHAALPFIGFGHIFNQSARLVLTCFFDTL